MHCFCLQTDDVDGSELPKDVLAPAEGPRENLVVTAIKFLQNLKVRQSPLSQKKAFLESKGLTKDEIQLAIQRAGVTDDSSALQMASVPLQQQQYNPALSTNGILMPAQHMMPSPPPLSPWLRAREVATTTAIIAAVSYAVYSLIRKFIQPWLEGKLEMEARQNRLEEKIAQLQASVVESNAKMADTLKAIKESISLQMDRRVQGADAGLRLETMTLNEIKTEISSLKGLLLNRRQFPPPPTTAPVVPAWQKTTLTEHQIQLPPQNQETVFTSGAASAAAVENLSAERQTLLVNDDQQIDSQQLPVEIDSVPSSQTSEDNLQAVESVSAHISVSQSTNETNSDFETIKSDLDPSSQVQ